ncbi:STN domain-containing protein [Pelagicoccus sp. SDUM812003]|uniref:STN domain-containing protein n=1 Tax=Pelagicoccus sp. SDUM812003 TaxID=3041267 RepID=UPI00280C766B|nr:STN domain-containing protein [Pelagicoccus sp. SDUM812003]MDQ8205524.1 STN domain-containing protein [Pelagicoccus sp. SDUM812003]
MRLRWRLDRIQRLGSLALVILAGLLGCARTQERHDFDLPAGRADLTLMQFAKQAKVEIIYDAEAVEGALTNAVSGSYSPSDALGKMLSGTGLTADRDAATGAFAVGRGLSEELGRESATDEKESSAQGPSSPPLPWIQQICRCASPYRGMAALGHVREYMESEPLERKVDIKFKKV